VRCARAHDRIVDAPPLHASDERRCEPLPTEAHVLDAQAVHGQPEALGPREDDVTRTTPRAADHQLESGARLLFEAEATERDVDRTIRPARELDAMPAVGIERREARVERGPTLGRHAADVHVRTGRRRRTALADDDPPDHPRTPVAVAADPVDPAVVEERDVRRWRGERERPTRSLHHARVEAARDVGGHRVAALGERPRHTCSRLDVDVHGREDVVANLDRIGRCRLCAREATAHQDGQHHARDDAPHVRWWCPAAGVVAPSRTWKNVIIPVSACVWT
jgi:hypothetical protein